jgi:ubiquinone biosynthesis monooxygenase Coq6
VSDARIELSAGELGIGSRSGPEPPYMARLTENLNLQRAALRHLDAHPSVRLLDKTKVEEIVNDGNAGGWPLVHLSTGQILRARLLVRPRSLSEICAHKYQVGADGFNSPVRKFAGIGSFGWAYPTHAVVATLRHAPRTLRRNTTAYQRFLPTGPIAFLPLSPTDTSLVWSTRPALAAALTRADPAVLASMVNAAFRLPALSMGYLHTRILEIVDAGGVLEPSVIKQEIAWREGSHQIAPHSPLASARIDPMLNVGIPPAGAELYPPLVHDVQPGTPASFPLRFSHADAYIGEGHGARTVLVGDAAHTIHPLAGQGLNGGLADVECLARCIDDALACGGDIGAHSQIYATADNAANVRA